MTKELVERLRDRRVCSPPQNSCRNDLVMEEAADTLESQSQELARLRGALERVVEIDDDALSLRAATDGLTEAAKVARAALSGEGDNG